MFKFITTMSNIGWKLQESYVNAHHINVHLVYFKLYKYSD